MNRNLRAHEATTVKARRGMRLRVTHGRVWLTEEGDANDYVLCAGETRRLMARGPAVLYGLTDASFQVDMPPRARGVWSGLFARLTWMGEQA
jgi:DUF2917 family protein